MFLDRHRRTLGRLAVAAGILAVFAGAAYLWDRSTLIVPRPTAIVTDRHGNFLAQLGNEGEGYGYWPVEHVPDRVAAALLALEDRRFWEHPGVDPLAVARALYTNLAGGSRISGASTVAMQVARMQHPAARSYLAKLLEAATPCSSNICGSCLSGRAAMASAMPPAGISTSRSRI